MGWFILVEKVKGEGHKLDVLILVQKQPRDYFYIVEDGRNLKDFGDRVQKWEICAETQDFS